MFLQLVAISFVFQCLICVPFIDSSDPEQTYLVERQTLGPVEGACKADKAPLNSTDDNAPQSRFGLHWPLGLFRRSQTLRPKIDKFVRENCSDGPHLIEIPVLELFSTPEGEVKINLDVSINNTLEAPIKASLNMSKNVMGKWIRVPCASILGSCEFNDVCQFGEQKCPWKVLNINGIPCSCPVKEGLYSIKNGTLPIPDFASLSILSGDYSLNLQFRDAENNLLGCLQTKATLVFE